jgi:predicted dehydrogenase
MKTGGLSFIAERVFSQESFMHRYMSIVCVSVAWFLAAHCPAQSVTAKMSEPLPVGIVGLVHGHVEGFFQQSLRNRNVEIVGIVEPDGQLVSKYAAQYGLDRRLFSSDLEEMLTRAHPQAVLVYTNTYDHRRVVEICARHGVHVMMEKPLAVSFEDALAIEKAARTGKIQVLVNYETTWYASNRAAYDLVHDKALGEVRKVVVHDGHSGPKEIGVGPEFLSWLTDPKLNGGGALFDFGCYGADLMTWLMDGERPQTVTAVTQQIKPDVYPRVDDEATIILTYPKAQAIVQASWNWPFERKDMEVYGQKGYAITVRRDDIRVRRGENSNQQESREEQIAAKPLPAPYDNSLSYLRAVLVDGMKPDGPSSLEINLTVTEILDAARRSAATGKTIRLPASR